MQSLKVRGPCGSLDFQTLLVLGPLQKLLLPFIFHGSVPLYNVILRIARNFLETRENIKISTHPFYHINLGWFSWEWSKKKFFSSKKKFKMADSKKAHFSKSPILKIFSRKFLRLVLGLVGLNDTKGIDVAQRIWLWGCPTKAQKQPKNAFFVFLGCFWAYVGEPHGHINALRINQSY